MSSSLHASLAAMTKQLNTDFKLEIATVGTQPVVSDVKKWIPSPSVMLNLLMGETNYGAPSGRFIEILGDSSHGKSTVDELLRIGWHAAGGVSFLLDAESTWDRDRAIRMGHRPEQHVSIAIDTCEMGFDVIHHILARCEMDYRGSVPILISWDTISASPTMGEKKGDEFESGMMYKARLIRQRLRQLVGELAKNTATVVFLNQTIEGKPDAKDKFKPYIDKMVKTTPGGGGVKFYASQRLQVDRINTFEDKTTKEIRGILSKVTMVKNKLGAPFKSVTLPLSFDVGIDKKREIFNYLSDAGVIEVSGAWYKIPEFNDGEAGSFYEKDFNDVLDRIPALYPWLVERAKEMYLGIG